MSFDYKTIRTQKTLEFLEINNGLYCMKTMIITVMHTTKAVVKVHVKPEKNLGLNLFSGFNFTTA